MIHRPAQVLLPLIFCMLLAIMGETRAMAAVTAVPPSQPATQATLPELPASHPATVSAPAPVVSTSTAPASTSPATQPADVFVVTTQPVDDDFAPGLAIFALLFLLVILAVIAAFTLVLLVLLAIIGISLLILLFIGILSISTLYGVLNRSVSAAAKALTIQIMALCGVPFGIFLIGVLSHLLHWPLSGTLTVFLGIICGAGSGAAVGYLLTKALSLLTAAIAKRLNPTATLPAHFPVSPDVVDVTPNPAQLPPPKA